MSYVEPLHPTYDFSRIRRIALLAGVVGIVVTVLGLFFDRDQFFRSYLFGYLFWLGIPLGCLGITMIQHLTGGRWGAAIRRLLEGGSMTLPLMAVLFVPILLGIPSLYEWSHHEVVEADPILQHKEPYLNVPFFIGRAIFYFVVWIVMAMLLNRWSQQQDREASPGILRRFRMLSGPGLVLFGLTGTFAAFDWAMSLEPHWYSTIYGAMVLIGMALTTLAIVTALMAFLVRQGPMARIMDADLFNDLGNLMLAFVMLWAYMSFSQFLIIYSGNLPEEVTWYLNRSRGGWILVPVVLLIFHFALPFFMLLMRSVKRRPQILGRVALILMLMHLINMFWLIAPAFHREGFYLHWLDLAAPIGIGGLWLAAYLWVIQRRPLVPVNDHRLVEDAHGH